MDGALADLKRANDRERQDYARLLIWLIRSRGGETDAANKELTACLDKQWNASPDDWPSNVARYFLGKISEADLFAAAKSSDANNERRRFCEAWFYAGEKKLLVGDKAAAGNYFRKCIATEQRDFAEYILAESELKALTH